MTAQPVRAAPAGPELAALGRYGPIEVLGEDPGSAVRPRPSGRTGVERPRLLIGPLTAPQPGLHALAAAARALAELRHVVPSLIPGELGEPAVLRIERGHLVRYPQHHGGVPVLGAGLTLRLDERGVAVRLERDVLEAEVLRRIDPRPTLSPLLAQRRVQRLLRGDTATARLHVDPETLRLCYVVGVSDPRRFESALLLIDAHSGELLRRIERMTHAARSPSDGAKGTRT